MNNVSVKDGSEEAQVTTADFRKTYQYQTVFRSSVS